jgi:hypothetical protein
MTFHPTNDGMDGYGWHMGHGIFGTASASSVDDCFLDKWETGSGFLKYKFKIYFVFLHISFLISFTRQIASTSDL